MTIQGICFACSAVVDSSAKISRSDSCLKCGADLHVCRNCLHYDRSSYNECKEPMAERVVDKEKRNFCDFFLLSSQSQRESTEQLKKADALKKLDDLFKK